LTIVAFTIGESLSTTWYAHTVTHVTQTESWYLMFGFLYWVVVLSILAHTMDINCSSGCISSKIVKNKVNTRLV
jgi:hypothetical protein